MGLTDERKQIPTTRVSHKNKLLEIVLNIKSLWTCLVLALSDRDHMKHRLGNWWYVRRKWHVHKQACEPQNHTRFTVCTQSHEANALTTGNVYAVQCQRRISEDWRKLRLTVAIMLSPFFFNLGDFLVAVQKTWKKKKKCHGEFAAYRFFVGQPTTHAI